MSEKHDATESRRRFLKIVGGGTLVVPLVGLSACSGEKQDTPAAVDATPATSDAADKAAEAMESADAPDTTGDMPELAEDNPQAKALAYTHDATTVDGDSQPRYKPGQTCANCALYQGGEDDAWAGCSIFPGRLVNGAGWCSVYAPKAG